MKFGDELFNNAIPEWRPAYVNYKRLKKLLKAIRTKFPRVIPDLHPMVTTNVSPDFKTEEEVEEERLEAISNSNEEKAFLQAVDAELDKVNKFFLEQDDKARKTCDDLEAQLAALYVAHQTGGEHAVAAIRSKNARRRARAAVLQEEHGSWREALTRWFRHPSRILNSQTKQLEKAFQEYYRNLDMLRAYRNLNNTAFYKIMKKHDKVTGLTMSPTVLAKVSAAPFMTSDLEKEIRRIEQVFTERLEHGDRRRAMQKLRVPVDAFQPFDWTTFGLGLWAMFFFFCMGIILVVALRSRVADYPDHRVMFAMYRGLLYPLIMLAFVAINMYTWRKFHVNYVLIFGLDHRRHTNYIKMLGTAGLLMAVWSVSVFAYLFQDELGTAVSPWSAVALLCVLVAYWAKPWGSMRRARYWLARVVGRMAIAPLLAVRFEDFWLADQFNSLVVVLLDLEFIICVVTTGNYNGLGTRCRNSHRALRAVIAALPAWWRLMQCLRRFRDTRKYHHIHNALKYTSSIVVVTFSTLAGVAKDNGQLVGESPTGTALFVMWILACLVNTCYATFWDLKQDWGLFAKNAKHMWLRRDMLYPVPIYYLAMVNDVVFRLSWTLSISVGYFDLFFSDGLVALLSFFEMWRRFVWNFFRVENEHLNNCGEFRAVRRIPMPFEYAPAESGQYLVDEERDEEEDEDEEGDHNHAAEKQTSGNGNGHVNGAVNGNGGGDGDGDGEDIDLQAVIDLERQSLHESVEGMQAVVPSKFRGKRPKRRKSRWRGGPRETRGRSSGAQGEHVNSNTTSHGYSDNESFTESVFASGTASNTDDYEQRSQQPRRSLRASVCTNNKVHPAKLHPSVTTSPRDSHPQDKQSDV
ncbi:xenotropic and polytropic murine leukemia virus receptor xpr1 [Salpingoeca rosetta]|uniref:Xenotropic and polytropic murine leukemia virus receptor xpr1 n=1 Tax=Salpingoeca rosetta (strain ATCC 50818 / BSB-021) TaxID=946362 RepID=F2TVK8_SALR5|nr:xenotropic and polytropic murine leukemia virus receptor xpr1 [Salpingoeca rosetta]EGD72104.1 xenotropic and polytropic murine leukemia virus receptor xpr1 [Salpingoeca rosetta]|eukprot:XP_004998676.1 xenotropic and polytropic murine leukemia virus receptor xpr1 [Salpingoeca rosetta]